MHRIVFAAVCLCASQLPAQVPPGIHTPGRLEWHQVKARSIYKQLVEIPSGVSTGNITVAARAMAQRFREAGIPAADIFVGGPKPEKYNVVARLRGGNHPGKPKPLLLLAHLDVVEARKEDWSPDLDPFVFVDRDGYYYGRGTADDKAMAAIFVANVFRMKHDRFRPDRDIIIALTADEEGGAANGVDWLLRNRRDLVDVSLVINEGGGGVLRDGKYLMNTVQAAEKITTNFTIQATNRGGHSSVPREDNAITTLASALGRIGRHRFPVKVNEVTSVFFALTAGLERPEMARAMNALIANPADTVAQNIIAADPTYNAMLRTTCVATLLKGGHATNALPQLAEANVNCRLYPTETAAEIRDALIAVIGDTNVQVLVASERPTTPASPLLAEVMSPIRQITRDLFGDTPVIPTMATGATDSRFFRALGIPAFGVSGIFMDPEDDARAHGKDERVSLKAFYEGQEFLYRLTKALSTNARPPGEAGRGH